MYINYDMIIDKNVNRVQNFPGFHYINYDMIIDKNVNRVQNFPGFT